MPVLGPGTLTIGATGTEIDVSCLVNGCRITNDKNEGDETVKLCGTRVPGAVTYSPTLTGNLDVDSDLGDGLFALSWAEPGSQQPFEFTPSTEGGTSAAGTVQLDPLDFGADAFGDTLTSDFTFTVVGEVTFTFPPPAAGMDARVVKLRTGVPIQRPRIPAGT